MKRLIDETEYAESGELRLADLVRSVPPLAPSPLLKQSILRRIHGSTPSKPFGLIRAGVGAVAVCGAAVAMASAGHFWATRSRLEGVRSPRLDVPSTPVVAPPPVSDVVPPPADPVEAPGPAKPFVEAPSTKLRSVTRSPASPHFGAGEDPAPVLEAIRALRTSGDPARASALLAGYLKAHPHSVLAEDALALSIEAAVARHDARSAGELGRRYFDQFPNGRYRAFAARSSGIGAP